MQTIEAIETEDNALGRVITTLYELIAALQDATSGNDEEVVATLLDMIRTDRIRWHKASNTTTPKGKDSPALPPPYIIDFHWSSKATLSIRSTSVREKKVWVHNRADYAFLYSLCGLQIYRMDPSLSKDGTFRIYRGEPPEQVKDPKKDVWEPADTSVNTFRKRLRKRGIDPDRLFTVVRGVGWTLNPEVKVIHFPSSEDSHSEPREVYGQHVIDNARHPAPYPGEDP